MTAKLLRFAMLPWWIVELLTTGKSFKDNPILGSRRLNRWGLHVWRVRLAHAVTRLRWGMLAPLVAREYRRAFAEQGYVRIDNFLPEAEFQQLKREVLSLDKPNPPGDVRECIQGDTLTLMLLLDKSACEKLPACRSLVENRLFRRLMMYGGAQLKAPLVFLQAVKNAYVPGGSDPQKDYHSDTFHPTAKAWLFFDDVEEGHGPFMFVPGSHRPTAARLKWEYEQSLIASGAAGESNRYSAKGSLRLGEEDIARMGFAAPVSFAVKANTLVIANTNGFHRRGPVAGKCSRMAIHASVRSNPFNPLPGFAPSLIGAIEARLLKASWRLADSKAEKRGHLSSWHLVPAAKLYE